jgi:hypothetical protein
MDTILFVDFNNADKLGRIRLNTLGALRCIREKNIDLFEGKQVKLDDEDSLTNTGILKFSKEENIWVAEIDQETFIHY